MAHPIQSPLVSSALQRLFRLQGRVRPSLEEFIVPTVLVGQIDQNIEPGVHRHATARNTTAAVAAQFGHFRITAPAGLLVELTRIVFTPGAAGSLIVDFQSALAAPAGGAAESFTDPRAQGEPAAVINAGTSAAALAAIHWQYFVDPTLFPTVMLDLEHWIVGGSLVDASFIDFQFSVANTGTTFTLEWNEYQLF